MDKLRLRFTKTGRAVYSSHLDLMRTMTRAFLRAGLRLKYSEGYNPHPQISILLPLSVGCSSVCELMDFQLVESEDINNIDAIPALLTAALPEGVEVTAAYADGDKVRNLKYLDICGQFVYDAPENINHICEALTAFFAAEQIWIEKKTKRGQAQADLKAGIASLRFFASPNELGVVRLEGRISAQEPTVNPELLVSALQQCRSELCPDFWEFTRLETYTAAGDVFR